MATADYIDPEGYWIDRDGNIHRVGNEGGKQEIIATVTEACSNAERIILAKALDKATHSQAKPQRVIGGICPKCWMPLPGAANFDLIDFLLCPHCDALFRHGKFVGYGVR